MVIKKIDNGKRIENGRFTLGWGQFTVELPKGSLGCTPREPIAELL